MRDPTIIIFPTAARQRGEAGAANDPRQAAADASSKPPAIRQAGFYFDASAGVPSHRRERLPWVCAFASGDFGLYPRDREKSLTFGAPAQSGRSPRLFPIGRWGSARTRPRRTRAELIFGSFRRRPGFAVDHKLFYLTGGVASGGWRVASTLTLHGAGRDDPSPPPSILFLDVASRGRAPCSL
jgi:high affinity Mn2+ porin